MSHDPADPTIADYDASDTLRLTALNTIPTNIRTTTEDALALDFTAENVGMLRYTGQWNKWLFWVDGRWQIDYSIRSWDQARVFLRSVFNDVVEGLYAALCQELIEKDMSRGQRDAARKKARSQATNQAKALLSVRTVQNIVSMARSDRRISVAVDVWDADPWLLNTPDGTVDLRTGDMRAHDPADHITRMTAVGPGCGTPKLWLSFLKTIMNGDEDMVSYLQKVFGYCLVGETKEHQMYFGYGTGANGKGVTLNTIRDLLGDYGVEAAIETFTINQGERHPTELADLRGARLVTCGETDEGQRWAEARIKMLTGGDPVKARFMRQDFFQFTPQFKLFLAGNHKPKLSNVDEAIERRFRLIPFTYTVPKPERDIDLGHKLREEWPQILHWCIEGCIRWQREGLSPPEAVASATKSYLSQEDAITAWYNEQLLAAEKGFEYAEDLYQSWKRWAQSNGEAVGTKRQLTRHLEDREPVLKIVKGNREKGIGFRGLKFKPTQELSDVQEEPTQEVSSDPGDENV